MQIRCLWREQWPFKVSKRSSRRMRDIFGAGYNQIHGEDTPLYNLKPGPAQKYTLKYTRSILRSIPIVVLSLLPIVYLVIAGHCMKLLRPTACPSGGYRFCVSLRFVAKLVGKMVFAVKRRRKTKSIPPPGGPRPGQGFLKRPI